tara:strand:- start:5029 stop:5709 length:681 start_codon:yes stop_codon:yes gene_type:complete
MGIPVISIPDITVPNISVDIVPPVRVFGGYVTHPSFSEPSLLLPGCYKTHRDADKNSNLINVDPTGTFWSCPWGEVGEITPIEYDSSRVIYAIPEEEVKKEEQVILKEKTTVKKIPKKEDKVFFPPCPDSGSKLRVGSWANEKRMERVKSFEYNEDKTECLVVWEDVIYRDQWIPETTLILNTVVIASIAAGSPAIINLIKGLTKNLVKKFTASRKKQNDSETQSD